MMTEPNKPSKFGGLLADKLINAGLVSPTDMLRGKAKAVKELVATAVVIECGLEAEINPSAWPRWAHKKWEDVLACDLYVRALAGQSLVVDTDDSVRRTAILDHRDYDVVSALPEEFTTEALAKFAATHLMRPGMPLRRVWDMSSKLSPEIRGMWERVG